MVPPEGRKGGEKEGEEKEDMETLDETKIFSKCQLKSHGLCVSFSVSPDHP